MTGYTMALIPNEVMEKLNALQTGVYMKIKSHMNCDNSADNRFMVEYNGVMCFSYHGTSEHPYGYKELAAECGISKNTVKPVLEALVAAGAMFIEWGGIFHGKNVPNKYYIPVSYEIAKEEPMPEEKPSRKTVTRKELEVEAEREVEEAIDREVSRVEKSQARKRIIKSALDRRREETGEAAYEEVTKELSRRRGAFNSEAQRSQNAKKRGLDREAPNRDKLTPEQLAERMKYVRK